MPSLRRGPSAYQTCKSDHCGMPVIGLGKFPVGEMIDCGLCGGWLAVVFGRLVMGGGLAETPSANETKLSVALLNGMEVRVQGTGTKLQPD